MYAITKIHKFFGIPGSGKTERLLTEIEKNVDDGCHINDIAYVTFSRSASEDAIQRIKDKFGIEDDPHYFATIHGICKRLLGWDLHEDSILQLETSKHRHDFLQQYGLNYPIIDYRCIDNIPETSLQEEVMATSDEKKIFQIIHYCKNRCIPMDRWRNSGVVFYDIAPDDVTDIANNWEIYKDNHNLVGFDDMLTETLKDKLYPSVQVLLVDEFQDLSPLLFKVIKLWMPHMKKVIVGGDDDQTIYVFAAASPSFLLNLSGSKTILDYSYRVPDAILQKAKSLIDTVQTRQYKEFKMSGRQGRLICLSSPTIQDILELLSPDKSVFFLFRTNFLAKTFVEKSLIPYGIPYWTIRHNTIIPEPWTYKLIDIRNAMVKIRLNQKLNENEIFWMLKMFPSCSKGKLDGIVRYGMKTRFKKLKQEYWSVPELLNTVFTRFPSWNSRLILSQFKEVQKQPYITNIENNRWAYSPSNIRVGTTHSAKGLEADMVFLFNNHSSIIENDILENGINAIDNEKRLYYVGATRAKETLALVDNFFDTYVFNLEL